MVIKYELLEDWLVEPERDRIIDAFWDDLSDPCDVYLLVFMFEDDTDLIAQDEFIMKIGIGEDANTRAAKLEPKGFELHAFGEFHNRRFARAVEKRLLKDDAYGKPVPQEVKDLLRIDSTECKVFNVETYNHMVDTLNKFFDDDPYPRLPEEDNQ